MPDQQIASLKSARNDIFGVVSGRTLLNLKVSVSISTPEINDFCNLSPEHKPVLVVVIDTEEEFDWSKNFCRENTSVTAISEIYRLQNLFDEFAIRPLYAIDYPVASQPESYEYLLKIVEDNGCEIGAHLHPWVTPPYKEKVSDYNSYTGNLPKDIQAEKIASIVDCIESVFGLKPNAFKAGRYGIGADTPEILQKFGFSVDLSYGAYMDCSCDGGPDFSAFDERPFWLGPERMILELPHTGGYTGLLNGPAQKVHDWALSPMYSKLHVVGAFSRLNIVNKVYLTPEGFKPCELIALTRRLYNKGLRIFSFCLHSPSVVPGFTPYVCNDAGLKDFLSTCRQYFEFFFGELNGQALTPSELFQKLSCLKVKKAKPIS